MSLFGNVQPPVKLAVIVQKYFALCESDKRAKKERK